MKKISLRACLFSPYLWALAGTPAPPLNVCYAGIFWLVARFRRSALVGEAAHCLNVQITYTTVFLVPIGIAALVSVNELPVATPSSDLLRRVLIGYPLALIALVSILLLAFFNVRTFAYKILEIPFKPVPRMKFFQENLLKKP